MEKRRVSSRYYEPELPTAAGRFIATSNDQEMLISLDYSYVGQTKHRSPAWIANFIQGSKPIGPPFGTLEDMQTGYIYHNCAIM